MAYAVGELTGGLAGRMTEDVYQALLTDLMLAAALLALFLYVARLSRGVRGIAAWGAMHFAYTLGTTMLDAMSPALDAADRPLAGNVVMNLGVALACAGMAGLACAVAGFAHQRPLRRRELAMVPLAAAASLAVWGFSGSRHAQTVVLSISELAALAAMAWHLFSLRDAPERLPARLMIACCAMLALLYGSAIPGWPKGNFGIPDSWISADVSIWFMLNFCMLMLASFRASEALRASAMADPLTGALNRRGLEAALAARADPLAAVAMQKLAVIAMDIDRFKGINDRHGHPAGDQALQSLAEVARRHLRGGDLFVRAGGDEFMVLLQDADAATAAAIAERIRAAVAACAMHATAAPGDVTISAGVHAASGAAFDELARAADAALYRAKQQGRNRVVRN